jgi:predicted  nucleic acid-binding Zn-ribbon protein
MRNDSFDELDNVPSLTPDKDLSEDFGPASHGRHQRHASGHQEREVKEAHSAAAHEPLRASRGTKPARIPSTGPLWALIAAMLIALAGLGWWSHQQIQLMQEQVVATQENFARISEEAAGRLQDISGKLVATESSGTSSRESLLLRLKNIETKMADVVRQQQAAVDAQSALDKRIDQLAADFKTQQSSASDLNGRVAALADEQAALKTAQGDLKRFSDQIDSLAAQNKTLQADIVALKKRSDPSSAIESLQQDLLVLRSELDSRSNSSGPDAASFDAFRAQTVRNISTIQTQLQNLQQQLNTHR